MCGINGITFSDTSLITRMNEKIQHRGPDGVGVFIGEKISFGQVRLSIIDLSDAGRQPMFYSKNIGAFYWDKYKGYIDIDNNLVQIELLDNYFSIVFNGEIYNYEEIKNDLVKKGYIFTTQGDTEVILAGFQEYGNKIHNMLNGMWAFCISDFGQNELIFSRDRFGIKPLYYFIDEAKNMIFSSEIKAILEYTGYKKEINEDMLISYLIYNKDFHISETFFKNILKLENAHFAVFNQNTNELSKYRYWDLEIREDVLHNTPFEERKMKVKNAFLHSLRLHNIADVEVGSCLSGGIDSSSIVCCVNNISDGKRNIKTFSAVFIGDKVDESQYIDIVNNSVNSLSYTVSPTGAELLQDLQNLIQTQEEPFNSTSIYNQYRVMKLVHDAGIKVTLDGQGGDEVFAGYNSFYSFYILYYFKRFQFKKLIQLLIGMRKYYSPNIVRSLVFPLLYVLFLLIPDSLKTYLSKKRFGLLHIRYKNYNKIDKNKVGTSVHKWFYYQQLEGIQSLLRYADKNSMRWGVESRVPFLEKGLIELAAILPFEDKINGGLTKYILRESMKDLLPEQIKNRYDKKGFETPENKWLKSESMKSYMLELFSGKDLFVSKYIDTNKFNIVLNDFFENKNHKGREIWKILNLELWGREYFNNVS